MSISKESGTFALPVSRRIFRFVSVFGKISVVMISTSASGLSVTSPVMIPNEMDGYFLRRSDSLVFESALMGAV